MGRGAAKKLQELEKQLAQKEAELTQLRASSKRDNVRNYVLGGMALIGVLGAPAVTAELQHPPATPPSIATCIEDLQKVNDYEKANSGFDPALITSLPDQCAPFVAIELEKEHKSNSGSQSAVPPSPSHQAPSTPSSPPGATG